MNRGTTPFGPFTMRWTEYGEHGAPRVLLLHGIYAGAHSYEWRNLIPHLSTRFLVRVPDLLGAGESDRPDLEYGVDVVQRAVDALIEDCGPDPLIVCASSLTGVYTVRSKAIRRPLRRAVLITPSGARGVLGSGVLARTALAFARHTPTGDLLTRALTSEQSIAWFQTNKTYRDAGFLDDREIAETRRAGRLPNAKQLQLAFVFGALSLRVEPSDIAAVRPTVIWACGQRFIDNRERDVWRSSGAGVIDFQSGLPQVEEPEAVAVVLAST
jgi:pimeloyl-ACP methyl ester carboxylesterase